MLIVVKTFLLLSFLPLARPYKRLGGLTSFLTRPAPAGLALSVAKINNNLETCSIASRFFMFGGENNKKIAIMQVLFSPFRPRSLCF